MAPKREFFLTRACLALVHTGVACLVLLATIQITRIYLGETHRQCPGQSSAPLALNQSFPGGVKADNASATAAWIEAIGSYEGVARDRKSVSCQADLLTRKIDKTGRTDFQVGKSNRTEYVKQFPDRQVIDGWCGATNAYMAARMSALQHANGIFGTVGEIGVHHGKFFIALAHTADKAENLFVCDVFDKQHLNLDESGKGDRDIFLKNVARFGIVPESLKIYHGSSLDLSVELVQQLDMDLLPFRLLSVDGGHTFDIALSDMKLAACLVADGGIVVLDDIYHRNDVSAAMNHAKKYNLFPRLRPFMILDNKLWYTTASHQEMYMKFALETFRNIVREDAAIGPQMIYAPQLAPVVFGFDIPIIAYAPGPYEVDEGLLYTEIRKRWLRFWEEGG